MESTSTDVCTLCTEDGISNYAVQWCTECEVFLCTDCERHHKRSKASKEHSTMSTVDYHKLPKSIRETSNRCKDHDKKYELYCSTHACPCCVQCITDTHQKCQDMKPLADILKEVKSSAAIPLLKKDLKDLKENFEEVIKYLGDRIKTINSQKEKGLEEVLAMRKQLNDHFDKLEKQIHDDLDAKHSKLKAKLEEIVNEMENRATLVGQLEDEFDTMTKYATELQLYVGLQELETAASRETKYMEDLESENHLDDNNLEVKISSAVFSVLQEDCPFGDISIKSSPHSFHLKIGRKGQAQHLVEPSPMKIVDFPAATRVSLDEQTAHREVSVSKDGRTFANSKKVGQLSDSFNPNRHKRYKGARGTQGFTQPGIYFYEVILSLKVVAPLEMNNIVIEIGIARKSAIDKKKYTEGQQYAYSMIAAHHPACDAACVHLVRDRKVLLHKTLMKNKVDEECRIVLGFLLNTDAGTWEIYSIEEDVRLCVVRDVNCEEPLFPVISGYNPSQVQATATFVSGH